MRCIFIEWTYSSVLLRFFCTLCDMVFDEKFIITHNMLPDLPFIRIFRFRLMFSHWTNSCVSKELVRLNKKGRPWTYRIIASFYSRCSKWSNNFRSWCDLEMHLVVYFRFYSNQTKSLKRKYFLIFITEMAIHNSDVFI